MVGSSGAGKSTFSEALADRLGHPLVPLDGYYWKPGWIESERSEWRELVADLASADRWVMDGNYSATFDLRMPRAEALVFLDIPVWRCLASVYRRAWRHRGRVRPNLPDGCPERWPDGRFLHWIITYPWRSRPRLMKAIRSAPHLHVYSFTDRRSAWAWLDRLPAART